MSRPRSPTRFTRARRLLRWGGVAAVCGAVAYGALPWLLPRAWLAGGLAAELSAKLQRPVSIEAVHLGYDGLTVSGLRVGQRDGPAALLEIATARTPLASQRWAVPARLVSWLCGGRLTPLPALMLEQPEVWVAAGADGWNIADLAAGNAIALPAVRLELADARLHFTDQRRGGDATRTLDLPYFACELNPLTGQVSWTSVADAPRPDDLLDTTGRLDVPRLLPAVRLGGGGSLRWRSVDLAALEPVLDPRVIDRVAGRCGGMIDVDVLPDLALRVLVQLDVDDLAIATPFSAVEGVAIGAMRCRCSVLWDPAVGSLVIDELSIDAPEVAHWQTRGAEGLRFTAAGARGELAAVIHDLARAHRVVTAFGAPWPDAWHAEGQGQLRAAVSWIGTRQHWDVNWDGTGRIELGDLARVPATESLRIDVRGARDLLDGGWHLQDLVVATVPGELRFAGQLEAAAVDAAEPWVAATTIGTWTLATTDAALMLARMPWLNDVWPALEVQGAAHLEVTRASPAASWTVAAAVPAPTTVTYPGLFAAPPGLPMDLRATIEQDAEGVWGVDGALSRGAARLAVSGSVQPRGAAVALHAEVDDLAAWWPCISAPGAPPIGSGSVRATWTSATADADGPAQRHWRLDLDGTAAAVHLADRFRKAPGESLRVTIEHSALGSAAQHTQVDIAADSGVVELALDGDHTLQRMDLEVRDLAPFLAHWPAVAARAAGVRLEGAALLSAARDATSATSWRIAADLTGVGVHRTAHPVIDKPIGMALVVDGVLGRKAPHAWEMSSGRLRTMASRLDFAWAATLDGSAARWVSAEATGTVGVSEWLTLFPGLVDATREWHLAGQAGGTVRWTHDDGGWAVTVSAELDDLEIGHPWLTHAVGVPLAVTGTVDASPVRAAIDGHLRSAGMGVTVRGQLERNTTPSQGMMAVTWDVPDAGDLNAWLPALPVRRLTGAGAGEVLALWSADGGWEIDDASFNCTGLAGTWSGHEVLLSGQGQLADGLTSPDGLQFAVDGLRGTVAIDASGHGQVHLATLDLTAWPQCRAELSAALPQGVRDHLARTWDRTVQAVDFLVDHVVCLDPLRDATYGIDQAVGRVERTAAGWQVDARGAWSGGLLTLRGTTPRSGVCTFEGVSCDDAMARRLRLAFPGVRVSGPLSGTFEQLAAPEPDTGIVARGELHVDGGLLLGKAAPPWMTRLFPGLDLARFEFVRLNDWFEVHSDGRVRHEAAFRGRYYHLYASGWERPEGVVEYEIGVDFMASTDSRYWATAAAGRIALFETVCRLDAAGSIEEESVSYVPLRLTQSLLWGANPVNTAYHAVRKRVLGED